MTSGEQSGQNAIEITGLSSSIDQGSARIHTLNESASVSTLSCDIDRSSLRALSPRASELQAMKEEPPLNAKCKDKFLIQSTNITPDKEQLPLADIVSHTSNFTPH